MTGADRTWQMKVEQLEHKVAKLSQDLLFARAAIASLEAEINKLREERTTESSRLPLGFQYETVPTCTPASPRTAVQTTTSPTLTSPRKASPDVSQELERGDVTPLDLEQSPAQLQGEEHVLPNPEPALDNLDADTPDEAGNPLKRYKPDPTQSTLLGQPVSSPNESLSDEELFKQAILLRDGVGCDMDKTQAVRLLLVSSGRGHVDSMLALADLYYCGAVAKAGNYRKYRTAALLWWDKALSRDPENVVALCRKGEALFQVNENSPPDMLDLAYDLFDKAASLGSEEGSFLKGKWLVVMAPSHQDVQRATQGKKLVDAAAAAGLPKAFVFLGHCYEFPDNYKPAVFDAPKDKRARERLIVNLYRKAAELNDPDGLNDIGSCYATGYGDVKMDFDNAVAFYEKAIQAGSLVAYDNLGTHYETGMSGHCPDRIDFEKALHYYRAGAKRRCAKCALNLGIAYEDGMGQDQSVLKADLERAEKYYKHAISLSEDSWDLTTRTRASKDLAALYITRIKMADHDSPDAEQWAKRLQSMMTTNVYSASMVDVNSALRAAVQGRCRVLRHMLGDKNSDQILERAQAIIQVARNEKSADSSRKSADLSPGTTAALTHLLGEGWPESIMEEGKRRKRK